MGDNYKALNLPEFPRAMVEGRSVFVIDEDGWESFWGEEGTPERAREVADEIQLELRAMRYVRMKQRGVLDEVAEELLELEISPRSLDKIIYEGCFGLQKLLIELSKIVVH